jgi:hypothetical protein
MYVLALQDVGKRRIIDDAREDARLFKIASELADDEERKRQWRVARGEVGIALLRILCTLSISWLVLAIGL